MDVTVAVSTFGSADWVALAHSRAIPSVETLGVRWVHAHAATLDDARNKALESVDTEWVCHLDADDELTAGYFDAMSAATADVRVPSVSYVTARRPGAPRMPRVAGHHHRCAADCLPDGNWIVVGAVVRTEMVRSVGGWRDFPWSEDWDLWLRCHLAGASFDSVPAAVYRAHVRRDSRNRAAPKSLRIAAHQSILAANGLAA